MAQSQTTWIKNILIPELVRQGWQFRYGKHLMVYPADKTKAPFTIALTPSDRYGRENAMKQLKKSGFKI